jgi:hypothetical protein
VSTEGQDYLARIPSASHKALEKIRAFHLRVTEEVIRKLEKPGKRPIDEVTSFNCR